jgi:uncharacterized protein
MKLTLQPSCGVFFSFQYNYCKQVGLVTGDNPTEGNMAKEDRGFASMDRAKQREIASKGGKAAHQKGTAHEWTSEEAREAGRKGGIASHRKKLERQLQALSASEGVILKRGPSQTLENKPLFILFHIFSPKALDTRYEKSYNWLNVIKQTSQKVLKKAKLWKKYYISQRKAVY